MRDTGMALRNDYTVMCGFLLCLQGCCFFEQLNAVFWFFALLVEGPIPSHHEES
jgi:hypothetical protein